MGFRLSNLTLLALIIAFVGQPSLAKSKAKNVRKKLIDWVRVEYPDPGPLTTSQSEGNGKPAATSDFGSKFGGKGKNGAGDGGIGLTAAGISSGNGGGAGAGAGAGSGGGAGDGGGAGGQGGGKIGFDDNRAKGGGGGDPVGNAKAYPQWYPMCLFIDPTAVDEQQANATVKGMTDAMAKCDVNLVVFPITVRPGSYPLGDPNGTNALQTQACNIVGNVGNAQRASTSICVNHDKMADIMCEQKRFFDDGSWEYKSETAGCAQVNSGPQENAKVQAEIAKLEAIANKQPQDEQSRRAAKRLEDIRGHNKGGGASNSGATIAPSIEDRGSCTASTVSHEAIGHSMFGHPNGKGDGFGIGFDEGGDGDGWTKEGCEAIRRNAFGNDGTWKYDAGLQTYYTRPADPSLMWDLASGRPYFSPPNQAPPGGPARLLAGTNGPKRIAFDDNFFDKVGGKGGGGNGGGGSGAAAGKPPAQAASSVPLERHKRRPPEFVAAVASGGGKNTYQGNSPGDGGSETPAKPGAPPEKGKASPVPRIGFQDDAPKSRVAGGSSVGKDTKVKVEKPPGEYAMSGGTTGSEGGAATTSEPEARREIAAVGEPARGGEKGATIGFDDEAKKGGVGEISAGYVGVSGGTGRPGEGGRAEAVPQDASYASRAGGNSYTLMGVPRSGGTSLDGDFFSQVDEEDEQERRKRKKEASARSVERGLQIQRRDLRRIDP